MPEKNQGYWQFIALFYVMIINTMYWMKNQSRQENIIYLAVWSVIFLAPLLSYYVRTVNDSSLSFDWMEMMIVWKQFGIYLLLFAIHNFLLAPLLWEPSSQALRSINAVIAPSIWVRGIGWSSSTSIL